MAFVVLVSTTTAATGVVLCNYRAMS